MTDTLCDKKTSAARGPVPDHRYTTRCLNICDFRIFHILHLTRLAIIVGVVAAYHGPALSDLRASEEPTRPLLLPYPMPPANQCDNHGKGQVRAALFGPSKYPSFLSPDLPLSFSNLPWSNNDVEMISDALKSLGVREVDISSGKLDGATFIAKLKGLAINLRCGDTLLLTFHGHASKVRGGGIALLFSDAQQLESSLYKSSGFPGVIPSAELSHYFKFLRARGVNVTFVLDAMYGAHFAGDMMYGNPDGNMLWRPLESDKDFSTTDVGAYVGVYPEVSFAEQMPPGSKNAKIYSVLTFLLAQSWVSDKGAMSSRELGRYLAHKFKDMNLANSGLTIEASHPDRAALAIGLPGSGRGAFNLRGREDRSIVITNPAQQRGAMLVAENSLVIEGKVVAPTIPTAIAANQTAGKVNPDGSFVVRLPVTPGENRIALTAWWGDSDFLPKLFTVVASQGNKIVQEGTRYALIIANQTYNDSAFARLETPLADAQALADRLGRKFGFKTELDRNGQKFSMLLHNAGKREIERALSRLRGVMTAADSLVVFYAGHGIYEKETHQAYWLPVDAEANEPQTWLSAHDIRSAIQRLEARHVLVVADSCFSGAFRQRSGDTVHQPGTSRAQFLINSMTRSSRMFISSGDNEPVSDGGGGGHSMFARALIDGLDRQDKPFTAGEIFTQHVKAIVGGKSGQSPQYFPMQDGHDGGEFVFVPVSASP